MIFFARPTHALVNDESFVLFLAQTSVTSHPSTQQLCPLHRQKQPRPRPIIPSVCLAPARRAVIAGRVWLMPPRSLSPNPRPALPPRKRSRPWNLSSCHSALLRPSALTRAKQ